MTANFYFSFGGGEERSGELLLNFEDESLICLVFMLIIKTY